jgi:hypothetical protein
VIAGTATAASGAVANRQAQRHQAAQQEAAQKAAEQQNLADLQQQVSNLQSQQVQAQVPAQSAPAGNDMMDQLERLGQLRQNGILTEEEFSAAKAKLLGM